MGADLGRLLEAEQTFAARVDAARQQARALVESARHEAEALGSDSGEALARARRRLAEEEERALAAELSRLEAETATRVERLGRVDEARVVALADQVLRALLEGGPG
jgi:vacuolar-type H+-ATPase subunit H